MPTERHAPQVKPLLSRFVSWVVYQAGMLKHRPRLWWAALWVRRDEFDRSLDMDAFALADMNQADKNTYLRDLLRRRNLAHERDCACPQWPTTDER